MSLDNPSRTEKVMELYKKAPLAVRIGAPLLILIVAVGAVLFTIDRVGTWKSNRSIQKQKDKIANTVAEIKQKDAEITVLEQQKAEKQGELKKDVEDLHNNIYGLEDAKTETNKAVANFERALASNSNKDASADDLQKALEKLDQ